ncbi:hypothetical protein EZZ76_10740 [Neisseria meningitidis]|nr:hypothetical protein [Neisseria meningitidis]
MLNPLYVFDGVQSLFVESAPSGSVRVDFCGIEFQLFPINACFFSFLDSHVRGNDGLGIFIESRRWCFYANGR